MVDAPASGRMVDGVSGCRLTAARDDTLHPEAEAEARRGDDPITEERRCGTSPGQPGGGETRCWGVAIAASLQSAFLASNPYLLRTLEMASKSTSWLVVAKTPISIKSATI